MALSQTEKRSDEHSARSQVKSKECDGPLAQVGETVGFKVACCEMAELEFRWVARVCLDRTSEKSEDVVGATTGVEFSQPIQEQAKNYQWQLYFQKFVHLLFLFNIHRFCLMRFFSFYFLVFFFRFFSFFVLYIRPGQR